MAPVVEDLVRALGERTGCAGLICADTGRPVRWFGDDQLVESVAAAGIVRRAPDEGHPAIVMLADGAAAPRGLRFVAVQPVGREPGCRYVLFAGARTRAVRYDGIPTLLRAVTTLLRRHLAQLALTPIAAGADEPRRGLIIADAHSPDLPIQYVDRIFCRIGGYSPGEVIGRNARFLQGDDRDQPGRWRLAGALRRGEPCTVVLRNYRRDGGLFENRMEVTPVFGVDERISHHVATVSDVTKRRASSPAPPDRDTAAFVFALEMSPVGKLVIHGHTGRACFANPEAGRLFGRRPEDLIGREMGLLPLTDGPVRLPRPDASDTGGLPVEMTVKPVVWGRNAAWLITLFDVVDRHDILEPSADGELALERYPGPVLQSRADGSLAWVSQAAADLLGYSREEMLQLSTGALDAGGLVDNEAWARNWAFVRLQRSVTVETRLVRRDGWTFPAVLDVQHVDHGGEETHVVFIRNAQDA
ncbi:MAG: PAS domain-containing protein [Halofilum sp. (in: g-proteobacteria)]|nr:PAS domain-containing protein [Halofilum sp. (in: g-proteobacteria)]